MTKLVCLERLEPRLPLTADALVGDIDSNNKVDWSDFLILARNFGVEGEDVPGDLNQDGKVGFRDFIILAKNFGNSVVPAPNVVLINLDDADVDLFDQALVETYFPEIDEFQNEGIRFDNFHSVSPLCGPSRASLFRGQYPHNTGVEENPLGWEIFYDRGYTDAEIGMWMRDAGYHTALVGKYCHEEYPAASQDNGYVPPGWDDFRASLGGDYFSTFRNINGQRLRTSETEFRTDLERQDAEQIVLDHSFDTQPLFLYVAPFAVHGSRTTPIYPERHADLFPDAQVPRTPDFNEADVSDKTPQYAQLPLVDEAEMDRRYRDRLRGMMSVDEMIGGILSAIEEKGQLENTYVMLTSDNGYQLGQHRTYHKHDPFDRVTRVPLLVRGPGVESGTTYKHLLGHIDLVPTILELARTSTPHTLDGKSFKSLLDDPLSAPERSWQERILIENASIKPMGGGIELSSEYDAIRGYSDIYVEWKSGAFEYYDLETDPYQLENIWADLTEARKAELAEQLAQLRDCQGQSCVGGDSGYDSIDTALAPIEDRLSLPAITTISGTASDNVGVAAVELVIRNVASRQYFDGTSFSADYHAVRTVLNDEGAPLTDWQLNVALPAGTFWVSARAIDVDGNEDPVVPTQFFALGGPDVQLPTATISPPSESELRSRSFLLRGTAADDQLLSHVNIVVRNIDRVPRLYWNGESYQEDFFTFRIELPSEPTAVWELQVSDLAPGDYFISARAFDLSEKQQLTSLVVSILD